MDRIVNTYDQLMAAGGDQIAVCYLNDEGRGAAGSRWRVIRIVNGVAMVTDPDAAWYDHHLKAFPVWHPIRAHKAEALEAAIAWVRATYPAHRATVFVRNRMGDMVPATVNRAYPIQKAR